MVLLVDLETEHQAIERTVFAVAIVVFVLILCPCYRHQKTE